MFLKGSKLTLILLILAGVVNAQTINSARKSIDIESYEKAKAELSILVKNTQTASEAYYYLGDIYLKTLESDSAKVCFNKGIVANPAFGLNYTGLGKLDIMNNQMPQAKAQFDKAISLSTKSKDYRPYVEAAKAYAVMDVLESNPDDLQIAFNYLEAAKKLAPREPEVYYTLGNTYLVKKDYNNAISNYNKALDIDKNYLPAYLGQSLIYSGARNYEAALTPLQSAIAIDATYAPAYRALAELYNLSGQYAKAVDTYKNKYMPLTDASCNSSTRYAMTLFLAKQYQEAYDQINLLMLNCPVKPVMYRLLGYSAYETKKPEQAEVAMQQFFKLQPQSNIIALDYEYMSKILIDQKKDSLALIYLQTAINKDPSKQELYPLMGKTAYMIKQYTVAVETYEKYIAMPKVKVTPTDYLYYGLSAMRLGEYNKADIAFKKLVALSPEYLVGYVYLAQVNAILDPDSKQGLAKPYYEKVITLGEIDPTKNSKYLLEAYRYMGDYSYSIENNVPLTKEYFNKILILSPDDQQANDVLKGLNTPIKK